MTRATVGATGRLHHKSTDLGIPKSGQAIVGGRSCTAAASRTPRLSSRRGQTPPPTPLRRDPPPALDLTNSAIAAARHVGEATVKTHVGSIFVKPGVRDRVAAIVHAIDHVWSPRERQGYLRGRTPVTWGTSGGGLRLSGVPPGADSD
jgi:hypothetical protein